MLNYIKDLILGTGEASRTFNSGIVVGVAIVAAIFLLLLILWCICAIVFRRKKCNGITLKDELGNIFISTSAITAAIRTLESEFDALVIQKIYLIESKNDKIDINVTMSFDEKGGNLKAYEANFKRRVVSKLNDSFGIENINNINIDNCAYHTAHKPSKKAFETDSTNTDSGPIEFQPLDK